MSQTKDNIHRNPVLFQQIQEDRRFLESVFDRIPGMIYIHDLVNDVNLYRSWTLKKILGMEESPVLNTGKGIRSLIHPEDRPAFRQAAKAFQHVGDNESIRFTYRMRHSNGKWLWFQSEEYVYERDAEGRPTKCLGYTTDLTDTIEQQQQLDNLNRVNQFLLNAARMLSQPEKDHRSALQELVEKASLYLHAVCDIAIIDPLSGIIRPEALYHPDADIRKVIQGVFATATVRKGEGLVGRVIDTGKELLINEVPEPMRKGPRSVDPRIAPRSLMYVPLKGARAVLGSLNFTRVEGQESFSDMELDQIRHLGEYLSLFVENALLKQRQHEEERLRREAEEQSKLTQDRFETLSLNSGDAFFFHDYDQHILDVNHTATDMLGYTREELLAMKAHQLDPVWKGDLYQKFLKHIDSNSPNTFDTVLYRKDGTGVHVEVRFVKRVEGDSIYIQSLVRDRTEKREQELKLQRSEERLRLIFDNVEDYIAIINANGIFETINKTSQGHTTDTVIGSSIFDFYDSPMKLQLLKGGFERLKATGRSFEVEDAYTGPDGSRRVYARKFIGIFHGNEFYRAILIIRDVTSDRDREHSEMDAVLRGQEQERRRLGAELHDGIGQVLSAIALQVSQLREGIGERNAWSLERELNELATNLKQAVREVRSISHDLMPEVLEGLGLKAALKQVCRNLHDRSGLNVRFNPVDLEDGYDPFVEMKLYRIAQELLNNIQKHAGAKNVFVSLMDHGHSLNLTIEDDGVGFDTAQPSSGIGLRNVRSRVSTMDGQLDIESDGKSGTLINIEVPKKLE